MNHIKKILKPFFHISFILLLVAANRVQAMAIFEATADASLSIITITNLDDPGNTADLVITGSADITDQGMDRTGNADATADGSALVEANDPNNMAENEALVQVSSAFGNAEPTGNSSAFHFTEGTINIENLSNEDTFEIEFSLDYAADVLTTVNDALDSAFAEAFISLVDELSAIDIDDILLAASDGEDDLVNDSISFILTIGPDEANTLTLTTEAQGQASSRALVAVPESPLSLLLATGVIAAWARSRGRIEVI